MSERAHGATPVDDISGLKLPHIRTQAELNAVEVSNISQAEEWVRSKRSRIKDPFSLAFYRELHLRMFGDVWEWAGVFRVTEPLPVGVAPHKIAPSLLNAGADFRARLNTNINAGADTIEFMALYHLRLVWIHPFTNGNGRWARLAADAVAIHHLDAAPVRWSAATLAGAGDERAAYIKSLRAADTGNFQPLIDYLAARNRRDDVVTMPR